MCASEYYKNNAASCTHPNAIPRYASCREIAAILNSMKHSVVLNESILKGSTIVDIIGSRYGDLMHALKTSMPNIGKCYCLDLPNVISDAKTSVTILNSEDPIKIELIPAILCLTHQQYQNVTSSRQSMSCAILTTRNVILALQSFCKKLLNENGKVIILDAVLPNEDDLNGIWNPAVSFDVLG